MRHGRPLAVENGTQRVNNSAASLDCVAAITHRLAYFLLRADSLEHLARIIARSEYNSSRYGPRDFKLHRGPSAGFEKNALPGDVYCHGPIVTNHRKRFSSFK
jgi:hypothetical protein